MDHGTVNPQMKLEHQGITGLGYVYYNRLEAELQAAAIAKGEGIEGQGGTFLVTTGISKGQICRSHTRCGRQDLVGKQPADGRR